VTALRVMFADDEEMARLRVRRLLEGVADVEIVGEARSGKDALGLLEDVEVDVALLDVRMGVVSGLDAAERAADLGVEVIMTTAHREHAVEAYAHGAVDYLLKPLEPARLAQALERARARLLPKEPRGPTSGSTPAAPSGRLALESRGEVLLIPSADLTHATLEDDGLVRVHTRAAETLTELTLSDLERRVPHLFRSHRRALVALEHVSRLRPLASGGYVAILHDGREVPVSRQSARALRRRLGL
jgi:two-component system LytT family response regulator